MGWLFKTWSIRVLRRFESLLSSLGKLEGIQTGACDFGPKNPKQSDFPSISPWGQEKKTCFGPHLPSWQRWWVQPTGASFPRNVAISSSPGPSTRDATDATVAFGFQSCKSIAHGEAAHAAHAAHAVRLQREWRASWRLEQWKKVKNSELRDYHGQLRDYPEYLPWNTKN